MRAYGAMPPCPNRKRGRHHADAFVTLDENGNAHYVWSCGDCGMTRLAGPDDFTAPGSLDDLSVDAIERAMFGGKR